MSPASVTIAVRDARRHLLAGVTVEYAIATTDASTAAAIAGDIKSTPPATVVTEMKAAGLTKVTTATVTVETTYAPVNAAPRDPFVVDSAVPSTFSVKSFFAAIVATVAVLATLL